MIRAFHDLKRHEEGQALVLAAISMLILTLCVLSTVNLSFAAKERIRLQNTADAAAYSTAAYQARAMNFFAYTNRAMTVHYASQMNQIANLSYVGCTWMVLELLAKLTQAVPVLGVILQVIAIIFLVLYWILDIATMIAVPYIDGLNFGLALTQTAVWSSMGLRLLGIPGDEVRKSNPQYYVEPIGALLGNLSPAGLGVNSVVNADPTPSLGTVIQPNDTNANFNRLLMTEMANAARSRWTAEGTSRFTGPFIPRAWELNLFIVRLGKQARTEMGSLRAPQLGGVTGIINNFVGGIFTPTEQIFSIDRFFLQFQIAGYYIRYAIDLSARADRAALLRSLVGLFTGGPNRPIWFQDRMDDNLPWFLKFLGNFIRAPLDSAAAYLKQNLEPQLPAMPIFHFGQTPYARFIPQPYTGPSRGGRSGLFNQPPVMLMVTAPTNYLQSRGGPFMRRFGAQVGGLTSSNSATDGYYSGSRRNTPSKRGYVNQVDFRSGTTPFPGLANGFHAISAAMAYYHRPGDWREPPNLFNPFWGAKLMSVGEYPTMQSNPLLRQFFSANLVAH